MKIYYLFAVICVLSISAEETPKKKHKDTILEVHYPSGVEAILGKVLTPTEVKDEPKVTWEFEKDNFYTLILVDIDAPSKANPVEADWLHWFVGNIPENRINEGDVIAEYVGAGPPKDTGLHTYLFFLYQQPEGKIDFTEPKLTKTESKKRSKFDTKAFITKYNLGNILAGNAFKAEYDDYVPTLHAQFTDA